MECEPPLEIFGGFSRHPHPYPPPNFLRRGISRGRGSYQQPQLQNQNYKFSNSVNRDQNNIVSQNCQQYYNHNPYQPYPNRPQNHFNVPRHTPPYQRDFQFNSNNNFRGHGHSRGRGNPNNVNFQHKNSYSKRDAGFNYQTKPQSNNSGQYNYGHKYWMTPELFAMVEERNSLQAKAIASQKPGDWQEFKALRARVGLAMNDAKYLHEMAITENPQLTVTVKKSLFYCDTCDRNLPNSHALEEHKAEHITCKLDGCTFTAHPNIILKHIQMQHSNDLFFRVKGYETPEQIKKWRQERKSNFPTAESVEKKKAAALERRQRGEKLHCSDENKRKRTFNQALSHKASKYSKSRDVRSKFSKTHTPFRFDPLFKPEVTPLKNTSPIVVLQNFYVNVEINEKGDLVGKKKISWLESKEQRGDDVDSESQSSSEEEAECGMNITDDEDDAFLSKANLSGQPGTVSKFEPSLSGVRPESNKVNEVPPPTKTDPADKKVNISGFGLGLVAYSSDSDLEDGEVRDNETELPGQHDQNNAAEISDNDDLENNTKCLGKSSPPNFTSEANIQKPNSGQSHVSQSTKQSGKRPRKSTKRLQQGPKTADMGTKPSSQFSAETNCIKEKINGIAEDVRLKTGKPAVRTRPIPPKPPRNLMTISRHRLTLLERLLQNEIRKERNCILQVCRFIEDNDFFGVKPGSSRTNTTSEQPATK